MFTSEQLEKVVDSEGNKKETLFTLIESAVASNSYSLKVFGTALTQDTSTHSIGKSLLQQYSEYDSSIIIFLVIRLLLLLYRWKRIASYHKRYVICIFCIIIISI